MTPDEKARAEAARRWRFTHGYHDGARAGFVAGAAWEREQVETVTTVEELEALLLSIGESAGPAVVREGFRIWIIAEDERGDCWAWSWREESEELGDNVRLAESLPLPLTVLYRLSGEVAW